MRTEITTEASAGLIPVNPGPATVVHSKEDAVHCDSIKRFCEELIKSATKQAQVYYDLVTYIRKNKVAPKLVSYQMSEAGFNKVRISEVNRVANAPDDLYNAFAARALGFKNVLQLVRGASDKAQLTPAGSAILGPGHTAADALKAEGEADETMSAGKKAPETKTPSEVLIATAEKLFKLIEAQNKRLPYTLKSTNGLMLSVVRMTPREPKKAAAPVAAPAA